MKKSEIRGASNQQLVNSYEELAASRGSALYANDPKSANKAGDKETAILRELEGRHPSGLSDLTLLLSSENPWVRLDAAIPLLFFCPNEAERVLEQLTRVDPPILRVEAVVTLDRWRQGKFIHWW